MDMEVVTEEEFSGSNDQMMIVKRKRTKRSRQVSSLNMIVTSSSSSDGDGGGGDEIRLLIPSNSMCSEISTSTEEDEDMANCLILLAQSGSSPTQQIMDQQLEEVKMEKINSRRFTEMATTTGKAGIYVYECKTCNRSFPSFQALGGHRASHKKSKIAMVDEKKVSIISTSSNDDHHQPDQEEKQREIEKFTKICSSSPNISIQLPNIIKSSSNNGIKKSGKIHECSICGSEFSSGQALGGHMRRHRNIPTSNKGNINIDTSTTTESSSHEAGERRRNILQLDLNLPAPVEDDHGHSHGHDHDSKFQFSTNQQKHVLFSSPAMVNCHY